MEKKKQLQDQIAELESQITPLRKELNEIYAEEQSQTEEKIKQAESLKDKFELDELIFSAGARCICGAGLAYPKKVGVHGSWICSDILLGRAIPKTEEGSKQHDGNFPFAFYSIKSENENSAEGYTTRPKI